MIAVRALARSGTRSRRCSAWTPAQTEATRFAAWLFLIIPAFRFSTELLESMLGAGPDRARRDGVRARSRDLVLILLQGQWSHLTRRAARRHDRDRGSASLFVLGQRAPACSTTLHRPDASGTLPVREMVRFAWHMALVGPMSATANPGAVRLVLANGLGLAETGLFAFLQSTRAAREPLSAGDAAPEPDPPDADLALPRAGQERAHEGRHRPAAQEQHARGDRRPRRDRGLRRPDRLGHERRTSSRAPASRCCCST